MSIVDPFGAEAGGTLDGVASGAAVLYSGTLFDVDSGELAVDVTDLAIDVSGVEIASADAADDEFAASGMPTV
ncbi:MAG: hypothetical protein AAGA42_12130 [Actinomycetota bacterium]